MKIILYMLEDEEADALLRVLLSGLKPDGVRLIIRRQMNLLIEQYEKLGAEFKIEYLGERIPAEEISFFLKRRGELTNVELNKLRMLENLYNTIDEWGVE